MVNRNEAINLVTMYSKRDLKENILVHNPEDKVAAYALKHYDTLHSDAFGSELLSLPNPCVSNSLIPYIVLGE